MENITAVCENLKPKFLVIDSIQTMYTQTLDSVPGSVSQVKMCIRDRDEAIRSKEYKDLF